jgi:carboxyl-terminal processing protease
LAGSFRCLTSSDKVVKIEQKGLLTGATVLLLTGLTVTVTKLCFPNGVAFFRDTPKETIDLVWKIVDRQYVDGTFNHQDWQAIRREYLSRNYQSQEEVYAAIRQMIDPLHDPYTRFIEPTEFRDLQSASKSVGVGITLKRDEKTNQLLVTVPIEDTPASNAGIVSADTLIKIDDKSTTGMDTNRATQMIRGQEGTKVKLTIERDNSQVLEFDLLRKKIEINSVEGKYHPEQLGGIGYLRCRQFDVNAAAAMKSTIEQLESQGAKGYILDLRSNQGGLFNGAIDIARMWLNEGTIVSLKKREGNAQTNSADRTAITDKPLVIMVDGSSASASEILAGAMQDHKRAQIVGEKTSGQGTVQSVLNLTDGSGMAVTIGKFYTPNGKEIDRVGIKPDVEVKLNTAQIQALQKDLSKVATVADPQYAKALETLKIEIAARN